MQIIVIVGTFLLIWPFLAGVINEQGQEMVVAAQANGLPAFVAANLNLFIFFMLLVFILAVGFFGSGVRG